MSPPSILRLTTRRYIRTQTPQSIKPSIQTIRPFSRTPLAPFPRRGSEDKDSINTEATEYSKSGTDDASARQEEAAFDPSTTDPQKEKKVAGEGEGSGNPLEVSPANPEVSKPRGETEGGAENAEKRKSSGGGSPKKAGK
ncbi:uncharacterized protein PAC_01835 [Phialocephala subalpina]|uniref:Uncharacterized protein n=1 Tax=Phialocephala subalpina TaxID=576137 RepID=A0A1L7WGS1_9HELO|nr:uncharacterized protein PAC_01835 [Phialocephala subalpina]